VRVGTRFVASAESQAHPEYVRALIEAPAEDSILTDTFKVMWDARHRVLRSAIEEARAGRGDVVGEVDLGYTRMPVERFSAMPPTRGTTGDVRAMALYAGQSVGAVKRVQPAREIVDELIGGAEALLRSAAATVEAHVRSR
jgi:NAD(P)H-dependent flavin oxidoreductase YrpB (nitropropane dioxygenase family)